MKVWSEKELLVPALSLIAKQSRGLDTTELISQLEQLVVPEGTDLLPYKGRSDSAFSQKVRNLISHNTLLKYVQKTEDGRMVINDDGYAFLVESKEISKYSIDIENNDDFTDENTGKIIPLKTIELDNIYLSVSDLKRRFERIKTGCMNEGLILDPAYQRGADIWTKASKSLFIESILLNIPIPSIYLSEDINGNLVVIDGRQRLTTLFDYIDGKFKLTDLSLLEELNGKKFTDLSHQYSKYKAKLEDRSLHIAKLRYGTDETYIIETFSRVNTKGARLNAQEIRNALHQGKSTRLLNEISEHYSAGNEIIDTKRMKDKYLILRYFAMKKIYNTLVSGKLSAFESITQYLGYIMEDMNRMPDDVISEMKIDFISSYNRAINVFGKSEAFRLKSGLPINMILFEITLLFTSILKNCNDETIKLALNMFIESDINENESGETLFEKNIRYHRDSKENIEQRLHWVIQIANLLNI